MRIGDVSRRRRLQDGPRGQYYAVSRSVRWMLRYLQRDRSGCSDLVREVLKRRLSHEGPELPVETRNAAHGCSDCGNTT